MVNKELGLIHVILLVSIWVGIIKLAFNHFGIAVSLLDAFALYILARALFH